MGTTTYSRGLNLKILAFEDGYDIEAILTSGGVDLSNLEFKQLWNTSNALDEINRFCPDILLMDYYIPPISGYRVLERLLEEIEQGKLTRPKHIVAMSSAMSKNEEMKRLCADFAIIKWEISKLPIWNH